MKQGTILIKKKFFMALALPLLAVLLLSTSYSHAANDPQKNYEKGVEYASKGKFKNAQMQFNMIPPSAERHYKMAESDLKLIENALSDPKREAEITHFFMGHYYAFQKKSQKAVLSYTKAIELAPEFVAAYTSRGSMYYFALNNKKAGCEDWKRACAYGECMAYEIGKGQNVCK